MVSIIITTCRRSPEIVERAIRSVIEQTSSDWELLVVDDSPETYNNRNAVRQMISRYAANHPITYVANESNSGACYSRNRGLSMAKGEYVAFLDDDDEWLPEKLAHQVAVLDQSPENVALVYCHNYRVTEGKTDRTLITRPQKQGDLYTTLLRYGNYVGGMSIPLIRTACVRQAGEFDPLMQSAQDIDLWLRLSKNYKFVLLDEPLVINYWYEGDRTSGNPAKRIAGIERLILKNSDFLDRHRFLKWKKTITLCPNYVLLGERDKAFRTWVRAIKLCPVCVVRNTRELLRIINCKKGRGLV